MIKFFAWMMFASVGVTSILILARGETETPAVQSNAKNEPSPGKSENNSTEVKPVEAGHGEKGTPEGRAASGVSSENAERAPGSAYENNQKVVFGSTEEYVKCLADQSIIADLKKKDSDVKDREAQLADKLADLDKRERALQEQIKKLDEIRKDIKGEKEKQLVLSEEKVAKLVETLETMSPKTAANMLIKVDENLIIAATGRIAVPKLAKILNSLDSEQSSRVSQLMTLGENARSRSERKPSSEGDKK